MQNMWAHRSLRLCVFALILCCPLYVSAEEDKNDRDVDSYKLSPERYEQAIEYARIRYIRYFVGTAYGLILVWLFLRYRISPRFRNWAESISGVRLLQVAIFTPLLIGAISFLSLPLDVHGHYLAMKYQQSIQGWPSWFWDWSKSLLISAVVAIIIVWLLYGVIRRSPTMWWFYFWLVSLPLIFFFLFITPLVIDPLFFKFEPLEKRAPQLVNEIGRVVQRGGLTISDDRMFLMNASEKLKSVNAYVTGFGASKRVVVWDTTLSKMNVPQTLYVFGHEMGHYVLHHILKTVAFIAILLLIFLFIGFRYAHALVAKYGIGWDIRDVADYASLPVLLFLFLLFSFLATPLISSYSRVQEHNADIYGLEVIHGIVPEPQKAAAAAFQILGEINLSDPEPHPFIKFWLYTHPPLNERLMFARNYDPWKEGRPPKYIP